MYTPQQSPILADKDLLYSILADEKRVVNEYATAVTESNCTVVRQMFTDLLNDTLQIQGELYTYMSSQGMYNKSSSALRQEVQKQIQSYTQTQQKTQQLIQQHSANPPFAAHTPTGQMNQHGYYHEQ